MSWREKPWVTRADAAEILCFSTQKVDRYVRQGLLRTRKDGRQVLILTASLAEYIDGTTSPESAGPAEPPSADAQAALARALRA